MHSSWATLAFQTLLALCPLAELNTVRQNTACLRAEHSIAKHTSGPVTPAAGEPSLAF